MYDSDNELNIALENIVAKKGVGEEGNIIFPESGSDSQIAVLPADSGLFYQGLLIRGETLKIFYKSQHGDIQTKLATELIFFKFVDDSNQIESLNLTLKYLDEDAFAYCSNCSVCA